MRAALLLVLATAVPALAGPHFVEAIRIDACCNGADLTFAASVATSPHGVLVGVPGQKFGVAALIDADTGALRGVVGGADASRDFGRTVAASVGRLAVGAPDARAVFLFDEDTLAPRGPR